MEVANIITACFIIIALALVTLGIYGICGFISDRFTKPKVYQPPSLFIITLNQEKVKEVNGKDSRAF